MPVAIRVEMIDGIQETEETKEILAIVEQEVTEEEEVKDMSAVKNTRRKKKSLDVATHSPGYLSMLALKTGSIQAD